MPTNVFILVYVGDPLDYAMYRHTALFFENSNGSTCAMHITGAHGFFEFEAYDNYDPVQHGQLARKISVAELSDSISAASIRDAVSRTLVKNGRADADWNCQNWVADALTRMVDRGLLSLSQRAAAINEMTDACLEAADEQVSDFA